MCGCVSNFEVYNPILYLLIQDDEKASAQIGAEVSQANTEEELQNKRENEVKSLRDELSELTGQLENLELEMKKFSASNQQVRVSLMFVFVFFRNVQSFVAI